LVGAFVANRFCQIDRLADQHLLSKLYKQLDVARSGFYAWQQRQETPGQRAA
jgi:hypothetical protein